MWEAVVALLDAWRAALPDEPARLAADHRYDEWAALEADAREYFGGRESGALDDADRARIAAWTAGGGDSLEAVAWAIDVVGSESYRADWRDFLGGGRHMLSVGELHPVLDAHWPLPQGARFTSRPAASSPAPLGELPHVRAHADHGLDVVVDFRMEDLLAAVGEGLDRLVAVQLNADRAEFAFKQASRHRVFPVEPVDAGEQARRVVRLVAQALDGGARVVVVPELSMVPGAFGALAELVDESEAPALVVAGSYHFADANLAVGLLSDADERLRHQKFVPFSDELGLEPPWKEGIAVARRPTLTVYQGGVHRFAVAICKDFIDRRVAGALAELGSTLVCVPAMSEKTEPFRARATQLVTDAQAISLVANAPLGSGSDVALLGQPVRGANLVLAPADAAAPGLTVFKLGRLDVDSVSG
jgi:hypothetical protein